MTPDSAAVEVHSVAEAYLYLMTLRCPVCGKGPVRESGELTKGRTDQEGWTLSAACAACSHGYMYRFNINPPTTREEARSDRINSTPERSLAIDLLGWLTLFQTIIAASEKETDRRTRRQLALEAAQCLNEALKFYGADNEMPPADAFFTDESRRRFHEHPQLFVRTKWQQRRLILPDDKVRTQSRDRPRWWQFWRRER